MLRDVLGKEAALKPGGVGRFAKSLLGVGNKAARTEASATGQALSKAKKAFDRIGTPKKVQLRHGPTPRNTHEAWRQVYTFHKGDPNQARRNIARAAVDHAKASQKAKQMAQATSKARRQAANALAGTAAVGAAGTGAYFGGRHAYKKFKENRAQRQLPGARPQPKLGSVEPVNALLGAGGGQPDQPPIKKPKNPMKVHQGYASLAKTRAGLSLPGTSDKPKPMGLAEKVAMTDAERRRKAHAYYIRNRNQILAKKRTYRARNKAQIARRQKMYRRKLKYGGQRKRRRISTGGHSYMYGGYT